MKEFKSDNEFDKLFQDTLKDDSITPSDHVWQGIESRLDKESNKPKFIFWLSLFIGIVLVGTISFLALEKRSTTAPVADKIAMEGDKRTAVVNSDFNSATSAKQNSDTPANSDLVANTTDTASSENKKENITAPEKASLPENKTNERTAPGNKETKNRTGEKTSTSSPLTNKIKSNGSGNVPSEKATVADNISSAAELKKESTSSKPITEAKKNSPLVSTTGDGSKSATKKEAAKTTVVANTSDDKKSENKNTAAKTSTAIKASCETKKESSNAVTETDTKKQENKPEADKTIMNKVSAADSSSIKKTITAISIAKKDSLLTKDSVKNQADTTAKKNIVSAVPLKAIKDSVIQKPAIPFSVVTIYGFYSPDYFYSKPSSAQSGYDPSKEKQPMRFSTGIKAEYRPVKMIGIQIGLAYSEIKQKKEESELRFSKYITSPYSIYSSLGEMKVDASIMKDGFYMAAPVDSFRFNTTYTQSVKFLNIPLNVKLNLLKGKFNVYVDAGMNTQIALKQHSTLNLIKENFTNTIEYNDIKINHFNYSVLLGLGAEYKVYKRLGIYIEPNIRYGLNNMSKVSGITNKPILLGGYGGICIYL